MSPFFVFYCSLPAVGSGIRPVEATDAFEAEQIVQLDKYGVITESLSKEVTGKQGNQCPFVEWVQKIYFDLAIKLKTKYTIADGLKVL